MDPLSAEVITAVSTVLLLVAGGVAAALRKRSARSVPPPTLRQPLPSYEDIGATPLPVALPGPEMFRKMDRQLDALVLASAQNNYCTKDDLKSAIEPLSARIGGVESSHKDMTSAFNKLAVKVGTLEGRVESKKQ